MSAAARRNLQVSNPRARLPFCRCREEGGEKGRAAPPSVFGLDVGVILLYGGGGLLGFLIASNRLALPLGRYVSVHPRELRLRRLRLVTSRYGFAPRTLAAHARPPAFSGRSSQLRDLY